MPDGTSTHVALCASCRVTPVPVTADHAGEWRCPSCGATDTRDAIHEELKAHAFAQAQLGFSAMLRDTAAKSSFMTFTPGDEPRSDFRWISDFKV